MQSKTLLELSEVRFVKAVSVGGINPNNPVSDEQKEEQIKLLNQCLGGYPKGSIIGKDLSVGRFVVGEHEFSMQKVTYHVGFDKKPMWVEEEEQNAK